MSGIDISTIELGGGYNRKLPHKKVSLTIHEANGGFIVEVEYAMKENDLYIVSEDRDLGQEIGKIITHSILQKHESANSKTSR